MIKNSIKAIDKSLKASKFTFSCMNKEGEMLLYNFKVGLSSLVKVSKSEKQIFTQKFISCKTIEKETVTEYSELITELLNKGILVYEDYDEGIGYDSALNCLETALKIFTDIAKKNKWYTGDMKVAFFMKDYLEKCMSVLKENSKYRLFFDDFDRIATSEDEGA